MPLFCFSAVYLGHFFQMFFSRELDWTSPGSLVIDTIPALIRQYPWEIVKYHARFHRSTILPCPKQPARGQEPKGGQIFSDLFPRSLEEQPGTMQFDAIWTASVDFRHCEFATWIKTTMFYACRGWTFYLFSIFLTILQPWAKPHFQAAGLISATMPGCADWNPVGWVFSRQRLASECRNLQHPQDQNDRLYNLLYQLICWYLSIIIITIFYDPCIQQVPMAVKVQGWCWKQSSYKGEFYSHAFSDKDVHSKAGGAQWPKLTPRSSLNSVIPKALALVR